MKDKKTQPIYRFKIHFSKAMRWLFIAIIALCLIGAGVSVWRIVQYGVNGFTDVIKYPFLIGICLFGIVLVISIMAKSEYLVDDSCLILQYGFIKNRFKASEITSIVQDMEKKKLQIYFGQEQFIAVNVHLGGLEELVRALLKINPAIDYSFTFTDK
jgi:hypothetical protein